MHEVRRLTSMTCTNNMAALIQKGTLALFIIYI